MGKDIGGLTLQFIVRRNDGLMWFWMGMHNNKTLHCSTSATLKQQQHQRLLCDVGDLKTRWEKKGNELLIPQHLVAILFHPRNIHGVFLLCPSLFFTICPLHKPILSLFVSPTRKNVGRSQRINPLECDDCLCCSFSCPSGSLKQETTTRKRRKSESVCSSQHNKTPNRINENPSSKSPTNSCGFLMETN